MVAKFIVFVSNKLLTSTTDDDDHQGVHLLRILSARVLFRNPGRHFRNPGMTKGNADDKRKLFMTSVINAVVLAVSI